MLIEAEHAADMFLTRTEALGMAKQAVKHQRTAQIGRQFTYDHHIAVSEDVFCVLFVRGDLTRTSTGMWSYCDAILWISDDD